MARLIWAGSPFNTQMVDDLYSGDADYRKVNKVLALVIFQEWHEIYLP